MNEKTPPNKTRPLFYVGLVLLPLILLLLIEGALRLIWTPEESKGLFIPDPYNNRYRVVNQAAGKLYFSGSSFGAFGTQDAFLKEKPKNDLRIFVLGGSSTAGYPTLFSGSFPAMLRARLRVMYPGRTVEVVNLGMTAVNTYTVRDFARECFSYQPDAIIIYSGHNEFYGALGTGSSQKPFWGSNRNLTLGYIQLKKLRLFRLWAAFLDYIHSKIKIKAPSQTLMATMAKEQTIPLNGKRYNRTVDIFRENIEDIVKWANEDHVPIILGTLVSNIKDQSPFVSIPPEGQTTDHILEKTKSLLQDQPANRQEFILDSLQRKYPTIAELAYLSGKVHYLLGTTDSARKDFIRARDLDGLRFRAPSDFNRILREIAQQNDDVFLTPIDSVFAALSPGGCVGNNLIWEHLHPNPKGYFEMGKAFAQTLAPIFNPSVLSVNNDSLLHHIPLSSLDSAETRYRLQILTAGWPFHPDAPFVSVDQLHASNFADSLALSVLKRESNYEKAHVTMAQYFLKGGKWKKAIREYQILAETFPQNESPWLAMGHIYINHRKFAEALPVLETALHLTSDAFAEKWAGTIWLNRGDVSKALHYLQTADRLNSTDPQLLYNLSGAYFLGGDTLKAISTIKRALRLAPNDPAAKSFYQKLVTSQARK